MNLCDMLDLEVGGEMVENLYVLYDFMIEKLNEVYVKNSLQMFDEVINLLIFI